MSFDPMAAAVNWLDAYRAGDVDALLEMYADDAVVHCGCGGIKTITGKEGLRAYWVKRLREYPASDLDNLQPSEGGTIIAYVAPDGVVSAVLTFNGAGQIASLTCGPSSGATYNAVSGLVVVSGAV
ncbi:nuclear transport factor 2 family protein [Bradyrhizobium sp. ISRA442]|nr:nuclear transport factor 2 family protein [Bradyrhizobium sp. ISRA432]